MDITAQMVKELRELSGAGPKQCKDALVEADGDMKKAMAILEEKKLVKGEKMITSGRVMNQGIVYGYIHNGSRIGALVELTCETDFVARNEIFTQLAKDISMQVASMNPKVINLSQDEVAVEGSPEEISLMHQPFIKDPKKTIEQLVKEAAARLGENISVRRFARFEIGAE